MCAVYYRVNYTSIKLFLKKEKKYLQSLKKFAQVGEFLLFFVRQTDVSSLILQSASMGCIGCYL